MGKRILITGGAGFIGSHLADELLASGHTVRALDNLAAQVHGTSCERPPYLNPDVELIVGNVCNPASVRRALAGCEIVFHLAAAVGVGQSMYQIVHYTAVNNLGTAVLLEALCERPVERLVMASSMSIYGEGLYRAASGALIERADRDLMQLRHRQWELCESDGRALEAIATPEGKAPALKSVYALSKYDQEQLCLLVGRAYRIPTVALRFFNVFGPRQALSNPYTGVLAIFAARLLNNQPPLIHEDGLQRRDFVNVADVARACVLAMNSMSAEGKVFNIGCGHSYTIREVASLLADTLGKRAIEPKITQEYRVGDVRHCFADISRARQLLEFSPQVTLEGGLAAMATWLDGQVARDHIAQARAELEVRGLSL